MVDLVLVLAVGCIIAAVLIGGCLGSGPAPENGTVRTIPPVEAFALIEEKRGSQNFTVIDVRRPDEFAGGHIAGAVNVNSATFSERIGDLDPAGTYVICCQRGGRSAGVREMMREAGFREVYEVEGGMSAWTAAGLPVTKD
ncbi:rhodanese-like domain-containing protein [Methanoculleus sp. Wushi-C6]|uniref:Rhodanese-like domain-containing protein n=1 Tax=Methanoculleus caldifontis TaxID=2651577 RepID=A0ABU3WXV3_9EURY|nr:rhodanese-like domain-containing protein [Methanoculleus sp. Wushi-C6]MDV2480638.1 rhodanese-like domain-containing protein [Methanoculleus sp. Wushi-C6]